MRSWLLHLQAHYCCAVTSTLVGDKAILKNIYKINSFHMNIISKFLFNKLPVIVKRNLSCSLLWCKMVPLQIWHCKALWPALTFVVMESETAFACLNWSSYQSNFRLIYNLAGNSFKGIFHFYCLLILLL